MKVGHARKDITPEEGSAFYLLGYKTPDRNVFAQGVHDHIFCNALLFEKDGKRVFLWSADLLELEDEMVEEAKTLLNERFGISRDLVVLAALHDHSSIRDYHKHWPTGAFSEKYYTFLMETICDSFREAEKNLQEATARFGREVVTGYYSNRNHPGELADNEIIVVKFFDTNNQPFAAIVNWAVHSTVLGPSNTFLTGDLAGVTTSKLGEVWGFYPLMLNGAAGDSSNRNNKKGKDFKELDRVSSGLATAITKIATEKPLADGPITCQTLSHSIRPNPTKYHAELLETIEKIEGGTMQTIDGMPQAHLLKKCKAQLTLPPFSLLLAFEVLDIGSLRLFVFPGELGSSLGKQLKARSKKLSLIAGYANGFHHYFLAQKDYGISFETIGNPVPPGEAEKIVEKFIQSATFLDRLE